MTNRATPTTLLAGRDELPRTDTAAIFTGAEHGAVPVSLFLFDAPPGSGPRWHRHAYPEVFVIHAGRAEFQVGESEIIAGEGDVVIAPAGEPHRFTAVGASTLRLTAIHPALEIETEWLQDA